MTKAWEVLACLSLLVVLVVEGGCATGKPMAWVEKGTALSRYRQLEVAPVSNETGKAYDFDVAGMLTEKIRSKLSDKAYDARGGTAGDRVLVLKARLTAYDPGNAAKRWLAPGHGATHSYGANGGEDHGAAGYYR
jgi:hypothetical protein